MSELLCTELSALPPTSTPLHDDQRRLQILLKQEDRFMPTLHHANSAASEEQRMDMLESIFEAVCQGPRGSDVYHLAANLLDRYLLYETAPKDFEGVAGACAMISMKIRRARKECPSYEQLRYYFRVSERQIRVKEKEIAVTLKWNLNAVTAADFIEELSRRLATHIPPTALEKLVDHSHTLASTCLLYLSFAKVPPSLLACACLCDALEHMVADRYTECVELLTQLCGVDQDVLLQHQKNVSAVFQLKLESMSSELANTPTELEYIEEHEHSKFNFTPASVLHVPTVDS